MTEVHTSNIAVEGERLRLIAAACRVKFNWLGLRRSVKGQVKQEVADAADADVHYLTVSKSIIKATEGPIKKLNEHKAAIVRYWKGESLPYIEPGWRLIRKDRIDRFVERMQEGQAELEVLVAQLALVWDDLKTKAMADLGSLANAADYPSASALSALYAIEYDFPSTEVPSYLLELSPEIYAAEQKRVQLHFEQAAALAEEAYLQEFAKLVSNITERLAVGNSGEVKVFKNSLINNLTEFFSSMNQLDFRDRGALEDLVDRAKDLVHGVTPNDLRDNGNLRAEIATQFSALSSQLEGMMVNRPRRAVSWKKKGV